MHHGLNAHAVQLQQLRRLAAVPYRTTDERGRDDDVPHIELIDRAIAQLQEARKALDLNRPLFAKADGFIEEAGRLQRELEDLPCGDVL
jgi:hypothetical protein